MKYLSKRMQCANLYLAREVEQTRPYSAFPSVKLVNLLKADLPSLQEPPLHVHGSQSDRYQKITTHEQIRKT
jgi:hypothetical protein